MCRPTASQLCEKYNYTCRTLFMISRNDADLPPSRVRHISMISIAKTKAIIKKITVINV